MEQVETLHNTSSYLDELNEQQRAAVEYLDGPELVIAGAGSGKTRVLTYKIMHLIVHGYEPWRILALTFTNKAAREMRERVIKKLGENSGHRIWMGTFHSIFARILRTHADRIGYTSNYTIYDSQDSKSLVKAIIKTMGLDEKVYKASTIASCISAAKNELVSADDYINDRERYRADKAHGKPEIGNIYRAYTRRMLTSGVMDFDDLLYYMFVLLRDNDDIRRHYAEFFRYVLVDEYQDTNYAQHKIIELLTSTTGNVCVVGDDAQSIYSFRGANLSNILGLKNTYPDLRMFKLERNYRSTENIINAAGSLIAKNSQQISKNVFSRNGEGLLVEVVQCFSDFEEAALLAARIGQRKAETGDSYEEFAVLYRTNAQSRILEESLRKRNIPYRIYGGLSFFQRKEVKDAVAYMRLALNPSDEEAIKRIINIPARKIGATTLSKVTEAAVSANVSIFDVLKNIEKYNVDVNRPTLARLVSFGDLLGRIQDYATKYDAYQTLEYIYEQTGVEAQYATDSTPENISKRENLNELLNYASGFVDTKIEQGIDEETSLASFMAEVSLATDADKNEQDDPDSECITLMTIHAAKGLEFDNVFIVGVEKDLLPSMMSMSSMKEIEEERRLLYVAITRAKRYCMMSFASSRYRNGMSTITGPSPFLGDIDRRYIRLITGTNIDSARPARPTTITNGAWLRQGRLNLSSTTAPKMIQPQTPKREYKTYGSQLPSLHSVDELVEGMHIVHPRFGNGVITLIDTENHLGHRIEVDFDTEGHKILLLKFAQFTILTR